MSDDRLTVSALRARNLPRQLLVRPPTTSVEIHTLPGGVPSVTTPSIARSVDPVWRGFSFSHVTNLYGAVPLALVVRESGGTVLGRVSLSVDAGLVEGWFPLLDAGELYVRVVRLRNCVGRMGMYGVVARAGMEVPVVGEGGDGELRRVARESGCLFRAGELIVGALARVPVSAKVLQAVLKMEGQGLKGGETPESMEKWRRVKEGLTCSVVGNEEKEGTGEVIDGGSHENDEEDNSVQQVAKKQASTKTHVAKWTKKVAKGPVKRVAKSAVAPAATYLESAASAPELHRLLHAAEAYAVGLKHRSSDRHSAVYEAHVPQEMQGDLGSDGVEVARQHPSKVMEGGTPVTGGEDHLKVAGERDERGGAYTSGTQVELGTRAGRGTLGEDARENSGDNLDKTEDDDDDDEDDGDDYDSETDAAYKPTDAWPDSTSEDSQSTEKQRRTADLGTFGFALFHGFTPEMLYLQLQDTVSPLPAPLGLLQEHRVRIPRLPEFVCTCSRGCNTHLFRLYLSGSAPGSATLELRVWYRKSDPIATCNDITSRFREIFADTSELPAILEDTFPQAHELTFLFVGGFFTQHYPNYFHKNLKYLRETLRLPRVETVPIHTEGSIERNAKIICESIMKTCHGNKSVVLIGHSKGGIDAVSVLHKFPEAVPFLFGIITFQAPFGGTFLVDYVSRSRIAVSTISNAIVTILKGDQEAFLDMGYSARLGALGVSETKAKAEGTAEDGRHTKSYKSESYDVFKVVPVIAFASSASFDLLKIRSAADVAGVASMAPAAQIITQHTGFACDGLVTPVDAKIPFADVVVLDDMLHTEPALYVKGTKYPPGELTASGLILLFEMAIKTGYLPPR